MKLTGNQQRFVLHWGEMGTRWGINRTVAQIHALLYISEKPLHAEEIAETLSVARSNVSNSLRELQGWGIVRVIHVLGDRRDHFESLKDVWQMLQMILDERKRREIDPTLAVLNDLQRETKAAGKSDAYLHARVSEMLTLIESMATWYERIAKLPRPALKRLVAMGQKVREAVGAGG